MYCIGAGSDALAVTIVVYSMAPFDSNSAVIVATVDAFWPMATYIQ